MSFSGKKVVVPALLVITGQVDCKITEHHPETSAAINHQSGCEVYVVTNAGDVTAQTQGEWTVLSSFYSYMTDNFDC